MQSVMNVIVHHRVSIFLNTRGRTTPLNITSWRHAPDRSDKPEGLVFFLFLWYITIVSDVPNKSSSFLGVICRTSSRTSWSYCRSLLAAELSHQQLPAAGETAAEHCISASFITTVKRRLETCLFRQSYSA
jgi:hypothetical protein